MKVTGKSKNVRVPDWQYPPSVGAHRPQGLVGPTPLPEQVNLFDAPTAVNHRKRESMPLQADDYSFMVSSDVDGATVRRGDSEQQIREQAARTELLRKYLQNRRDRERHLAIIDMWLEKNGYLLRSKDLYGGVK